MSSNAAHESQSTSKKTPAKVGPAAPVTAQGSHPASILQRFDATPDMLTPQDVLQLQGTIGNSAVGELLGRASPSQSADSTTDGPGPSGGDTHAANESAHAASSPALASVQRQPEMSAEMEGEGEGLEAGEWGMTGAGQSFAPPAPPDERPEGRSSFIQAKLTVGSANDPYEQEADRIADQVMTTSAQTPPAVQRLPGEKESTPAKPLPTPVTRLLRYRTLSPGELQRNGLPPQDLHGSFDTSPNFEGRLSSTKGGGAPMPIQTRSFMESRFGSDFSQVRVHTGAEAVQLSREIGAQAFTHGNDIYFGAGKYDPDSSSGKRLLAHELTHTIQQGAGGSASAQRYIQRQTIAEELCKAWGLPVQLLSSVQNILQGKDVKKELTTVGLSVSKVTLKTTLKWGIRLGYTELIKQLTTLAIAYSFPITSLIQLKSFVDSFLGWLTTIRSYWAFLPKETRTLATYVFLSALYSLGKMVKTDFTGEKLFPFLATFDDESKRESTLDFMIYYLEWAQSLLVKAAEHDPYVPDSLSDLVNDRGVDPGFARVEEKLNTLLGGVSKEEHVENNKNTMESLNLKENFKPTNDLSTESTNDPNVEPNTDPNRESNVGLTTPSTIPQLPPGTTVLNLKLLKIYVHGLELRRSLTEQKTQEDEKEKKGRGGLFLRAGFELDLFEKHFEFGKNPEGQEGLELSLPWGLKGASGFARGTIIDHQKPIGIADMIQVQGIKISNVRIGDEGLEEGRFDLGKLTVGPNSEPYVWADNLYAEKSNEFLEFGGGFGFNLLQFKGGGTIDFKLDENNRFVEASLKDGQAAFGNTVTFTLGGATVTRDSLDVKDALLAIKFGQGEGVQIGANLRGTKQGDIDATVTMKTNNPITPFPGLSLNNLKAEYRKDRELGSRIGASGDVAVDVAGLVTGNAEQLGIAFSSTEGFSGGFKNLLIATEWFKLSATEGTVNPAGFKVGSAKLTSAQGEEWAQTGELSLSETGFSVTGAKIRLPAFLNNSLLKLETFKVSKSGDLTVNGALEVGQVDFIKNRFFATGVTVWADVKDGKWIFGLKGQPQLHLKDQTIGELHSGGDFSGTLSWINKQLKFTGGVDDGFLNGKLADILQLDIEGFNYHYDPEKPDPLKIAKGSLTITPPGMPGFQMEVENLSVGPDGLDVEQASLAPKSKAPIEPFPGLKITDPALKLQKKDSTFKVSGESGVELSYRTPYVYGKVDRATIAFGSTGLSGGFDKLVLKTSLFSLDIGKTTINSEGFEIESAGLRLGSGDPTANDKEEKHDDWTSFIPGLDLGLLAYSLPLEIAVESISFKRGEGLKIGSFKPLLKKIPLNIFNIVKGELDPGKRTGWIEGAISFPKVCLPPFPPLWPLRIEVGYPVVPGAVWVGGALEVFGEITLSARADVTRDEGPGQPWNINGKGTFSGNAGVKVGVGVQLGSDWIIGLYAGLYAQAGIEMTADAGFEGKLAYNKNDKKFKKEDIRLSYGASGAVKSDVGLEIRGKIFGFNKQLYKLSFYEWVLGEFEFGKEIREDSEGKPKIDAKPGEGLGFGGDGGKPKAGPRVDYSTVTMKRAKQTLEDAKEQLQNDEEVDDETYQGMVKEVVTAHLKSAEETRRLIEKLSKKLTKLESKVQTHPDTSQEKLQEVDEPIEEKGGTYQKLPKREKEGKTTKDNKVKRSHSLSKKLKNMGEGVAKGAKGISNKFKKMEEEAKNRKIRKQSDTIKRLTEQIKQYQDEIERVQQVLQNPEEAMTGSITKIQEMEAALIKDLTSIDQEFSEPEEVVLVEPEGENKKVEGEQKSNTSFTPPEPEPPNSSVRFKFKAEDHQTDVLRCIQASLREKTLAPGDWILWDNDYYEVTEAGIKNWNGNQIDFAELDDYLPKEHGWTPGAFQELLHEGWDKRDLRWGPDVVESYLQQDWSLEEIQVAKEKGWIPANFKELLDDGWTYQDLQWIVKGKWTPVNFKELLDEGWEFDDLRRLVNLGWTPSYLISLYMMGWTPGRLKAQVRRDTPEVRQNVSEESENNNNSKTVKDTKDTPQRGEMELEDNLLTPRDFFEAGTLGWTPEMVNWLVMVVRGHFGDLRTAVKLRWSPRLFKRFYEGGWSLEELRQLMAQEWTPNAFELFYEAKWSMEERRQLVVQEWTPERFDRLSKEGWKLNELRQMVRLGWTPGAFDTVLLKGYEYADLREIMRLGWSFGQFLVEELKTQRESEDTF